MKKGILLIAVGHAYYGRMAYNLALTLKAAEDSLPIALVYDASALSHLTEAQKKVFDILIKAEAGADHFKTVNSMRMSLPKLSPFDETIALDVDMVWMGGKPSALFDLLGEKDFTIVNEGYTDLDTGEDHTTKIYTYWAPLEEIRQAYGLTGKFYQVRGEFIIFRKCKAVTDLYKLAKRIQAKPLVDPTRLGHSVTDEFALNIALNLKGVEPHASKWQPTYWMNRHKNILPPLSKINKEYYALSLGGNLVPMNLKNMHDVVVKAACYNLGLPFLFTVQPKRSFLPERKIS